MVKKKKATKEPGVIRVNLEIFQKINSHKIPIVAQDLSIHFNHNEFTPSSKPQPPSKNAVSNLCSKE